MSGPSAEEALQSEGVLLIVQLARTLRIVAVHDLANEAAIAATGQLLVRVNEALAALRTIRVQVAEGGLYLNNMFLKLKGAAFESGAQLEALFDKLEINELEINERLDNNELEGFLRHFQVHVRAAQTEPFAAIRLPKIGLRSKARSHGVDIDRRTELARAYAQLVVYLTDAVERLRDQQAFPMVRLRRIVQQLADAARGQDSLLVGLANHIHERPDPATHAAATTGLVMAMGLRLGVSKKALAELALAAALHDLGDSARSAEQRALQTVIDIARVTRSVDAFERIAVALEVRHSADGEGPQPGVPARLVAVAACFVRLTQPGGGRRGVAPDQALRLILDDAGRRFDRRAAKLFAAVLGRYPPGSLVRLSGGQTAVVLSTPEGADQPTVRVIEAQGAAADYVLELARPDAGVEVAESLAPQTAAMNPTRFLLA